MKTIYVVQNSEDEPIMAFYDRETAEYVAKKADGARGYFTSALLIESERVTQKQIEEMGE